MTLPFQLTFFLWSLFGTLIPESLAEEACGDPCNSEALTPGNLNHSLGTVQFFKSLDHLHTKWVRLVRELMFKPVMNSLYF